MPYCSECGSFHAINDLTCGSCGHSFDREHARVEIRNGVQIPARSRNGEGDHFQGKTVRDELNGRAHFEDRGTDPAVPIKDGFAGFTGMSNGETFAEGNFVRLNEESQMGKGLIKPNSIEVGMDGFHFKYDRPLGNFVKAEPISNKVLEYRAKNNEPEHNLMTDNLLISETVNVAEDGQFMPEVQDIAEMSEALPDVDAPVSEENEVLTGDDSVEPIEAEPSGVEIVPAAEEPYTESELDQLELVLDEPEFPGPELLEPELLEPEYPQPEFKLRSEYETLWGGRCTFMGIPLETSYRISAQSVLVSDRRLRKYSEIDLVLIVEVRLKQSWFDKIFGVGDILITVKDLPEPGLVLSKIRNPEEVYKLLQDLIRA